jgi:hypothetical protein
MKQTNSSRPSSVPDLRSLRLARHRNGDSSTAAIAKRTRMIHTGEKLAVSAFMAGKVVPQTMVTTNRARMPENWRFMSWERTYAVGKGSMVTPECGAMLDG